MISYQLLFTLIQQLLCIQTQLVRIRFTRDNNNTKLTYWWHGRWHGPADQVWTPACSCTWSCLQDCDRSVSSSRVVHTHSHLKQQRHIQHHKLYMTYKSRLLTLSNGLSAGLQNISRSALDYRTNVLYRTPNHNPHPNPSPLARCIVKCNPQQCNEL